jgi:hypothetical protein
MPRDTALAQWVEDHQVTWELLPHRGSRGEVEGEDVVLFARHPELREGDPGCEECQHIYATLCEIAAHVVPPVAPGVRIALSPFDAAFRLRPASEWAPEVVVQIEITPRGVAGAADDGLRRCVHAIESGLQDLGGQPGSWHPPG